MLFFYLFIRCRLQATNDFQDRKSGSKKKTQHQQQLRQLGKQIQIKDKKKQEKTKKTKEI